MKDYLRVLLAALFVIIGMGIAFIAFQDVYKSLGGFFMVIVMFALLGLAFVIFNTKK